MTNAFVGGSYELNIRKADVQRAVNLRPVMNEVPGGKSVSYLDSSEGLSVFSQAAVSSDYLLLEDGYYLLLEDGGRLILEP